MRKPGRSRRRRCGFSRGKKVFLALELASLLCAVVSGSLAAVTVWSGFRDEWEFEELSRLKEAGESGSRLEILPETGGNRDGEAAEPGETGEGERTEKAGEAEPEEAEETAGMAAGEAAGMAMGEAGSAEGDNAARFAALYGRNPDFVGWLTVDGTRIDYPVMLTPNEPEYYLHRNFDRERSAGGTPFIGAGCSLDSDNILIYGHHMKNGTMFADLLDYGDEKFYTAHPTFTFDTMERSARYEILAAFFEKVHSQGETDVFRYYDYGGDLSREQFEEYLKQVSRAALYETGVTAAYGDRLLTLTTCAYQTANGRFIVVARRQD